LKFIMNDASEVTNIEKLEIATARFVSKWKKPSRIGTAIPPPPIPAILLKAFTVAKTK